MRALILIDLQNDFFPGGALGIPQAENIFPLANNIQRDFEYIFASKDWHPIDHISFAVNHPGHADFDVININGIEQVLWPVHCVQETFGAEFNSKLNTAKFTDIIYKGTDSTIDSYSCFFDNKHLKDTSLNRKLTELKIRDLYFMGLATDYCLKYTVLDSLELGYNTYVIKNGCFGINKNPGDVELAFKEMQNSGAKLIEWQGQI